MPDVASRPRKEAKLLADQTAVAEQAKEAERQHGTAQAAATLAIQEMTAKLLAAKKAAADTAKDVEALHAAERAAAAHKISALQENSFENRQYYGCRFGEGIVGQESFEFHETDYFLWAPVIKFTYDKSGEEVADEELATRESVLSEK
ncbi:MAG: hypothetical protein M1826_001634 [Phylliscum demangeonii]|nr:MAG: hypothetical protein M1826_001634 [Phylliscum demangeonii]